MVRIHRGTHSFSSGLTALPGTTFRRLLRRSRSTPGRCASGLRRCGPDGLDGLAHDRTDGMATATNDSRFMVTVLRPSRHISSSQPIVRSNLRHPSRVKSGCRLTFGRLPSKSGAALLNWKWTARIRYGAYSDRRSPLAMCGEGRCRASFGAYPDG